MLTVISDFLRSAAGTIEEATLFQNRCRRSIHFYGTQWHTPGRRGWIRKGEFNPRVKGVLHVCCVMQRDEGIRARSRQQHTPTGTGNHGCCWLGETRRQNKQP